MFYQHEHFGGADYFVKEYREDFSFPPHMHFSFEFIVVTEGEMTVTVDGQEELLSIGEGMLVLPNRLHALSSSSSKHMLCIFAPDLVAAFWEQIRGKRPQSYRFTPNAALVAALHALTGEEDLIYKKGLLYLLCSEFLKGREFYSSEKEEKDLLSQVFRFVENGYAEDCSLMKIASSVGYEYGYLSRYFKNRVGISFTEYLNRYRLNRACYHLTNTDKTVLECAMEVGYDSLRTFTRNFRRVFGVSASEYRRTGGKIPPHEKE